MHTFPVVDGKPIVLDPRVTSECLECGLALSTPGPVAIEPRNAIAWTIAMAAQDAGQLRNGPSQLYLGKHPIRRLTHDGAVPAQRDVHVIGLLFAPPDR